MSNRQHNKYRKLYEQYHGPIPVDADGRSYDIHHVDGDYTNNSPENLVALSIKDHYKTHYNQKDWGACWSISLRMNLTPTEKSDISRKVALDRVKDGTNPFLNGARTRRYQLSKIADGTHPFIGSNQKEKHPQYDHTIRIWHNKKTNQVVEMTAYELRTTYNLHGSGVSLVINGKRTAVKGWEQIGIKQIKQGDVHGTND